MNSPRENATSTPPLSRTSVLIVGAGPTGLVHALWLARRGIAVRIIDQSAGPGLTSRALAVQARTLEFYRQLGIADELIALGVVAGQVTLRRRARVVAIARLGAIGEELTPFPYLVFVPQDLHEKLLVSKLAEAGVHVERGTQLIDFVQDESRVTATIQH
jgi:2-polyprenyl-6-methoxyphenol hydroxylase-like FAD-dependent oxidoreductase